MEELNYRFFELFNKVDRLCVQVYQNEHGLADYIEDMRSISVYSVEDIPDWERDLFQLITLRNIRSSLINSPDAFQDTLCTQEQMQWLEEFHQRILDRQDPMALLEEYGYHAGEDSQNKRIEVRDPEIEKGISSAHERHVNGILVAALLVILVLATCAVTVIMFLPDDLF